MPKRGKVVRKASRKPVKKVRKQIDFRAMKEAENAVRDLKNWIFVFAHEYDLPDEALNTLHAKVDELAVKISRIK